MLDRLALHDDGIRALRKNRLDGELMGHAQVPQRPHERRVARLTLVPPAAQRREARADEDLVDWREISNPRIPTRERPRVVSEKHRKRRILKTAEPRRDTEMAEVGDDLDTQIAQTLHRRVRRLPVVPIRSDMRAIVRRTV